MSTCLRDFLRNTIKEEMKMVFVLDLLELVQLELFIIILLFAGILSFVRKIKKWINNRKCENKKEENS